MKYWVFLIAGLLSLQSLFAQLREQSIQTSYVLEAVRRQIDVRTRDTLINVTVKEPLDGDAEYDYADLCYSASQFMIQSPQVEAALDTLLRHYKTIQYSTKRALLETLSGLYPSSYVNDIRILMMDENNPKLFAMQAAYLYAADPSLRNKRALLNVMRNRFPAGGNNVLRQLGDYLYNYETYKKTPTPPLNELFAYQAARQCKTIYSFQRWNRDYPGLAVLQNADGSFAVDSTGKLLVFEQLARSVSNLPYFITDGNTPQGVYAVTGVANSHLLLLGPTPNIQMVMPFEDNEAYWGDEFDDTKDTITNYLNQLPPAWRHYAPVTEAYYAGKIGRSSIIAHGTTVDPKYFSGKPYYPISPTLGCLCAKEIWNTATGTLAQSEQLNLVNAFTETPGTVGRVIVINIDDKQAPVSRQEAEQIVKGYTRL